jgi:hypothetical protein
MCAFYAKPAKALSIAAFDEVQSFERGDVVQLVRTLPYNPSLRISSIFNCLKEAPRSALSPGRFHFWSLIISANIT